MPYRQKHTWIFGGPQKGWTESLYAEGIAGSVNAGLVIAQQVAVARAQCLGFGLFIKAIRIQEVESAGGQPLKRRGDTFQGTYYQGSGQEPAAAPDLSLLLDMTNTTGNRHRLGYMGGIWDSISQGFGVYTPSPAWTSALNNYLVKLIEFNYGWMGRTPSIDYVVTNFTQDDDAYITFTTSGTPFAGKGDEPFLVRIHDLPSIGGKSLLNGDQMVTRVTDNSCKTTTRIATTPFVGAGFLNLFTNAYEEIGNIGPEKIVSRERGAPLLESRGRRRARAKT